MLNIGLFPADYTDQCRFFCVNHFDLREYYEPLHVEFTSASINKLDYAQDDD